MTASLTCFTLHLPRSEYFKAALSSTWEREGRAEQTLQAAPAAVAIAIDFMYGIEVPAHLGLEAPGGLAEVLRLADMLLAEELKEEVARRLAISLAVDNYRCLESCLIHRKSF